MDELEAAAYWPDSEPWMVVPLHRAREIVSTLADERDGWIRFALGFDEPALGRDGPSVVERVRAYTEPSETVLAAQVARAGGAPEASSLVGDECDCAYCTGEAWRAA